MSQRTGRRTVPGAATVATWLIAAACASAPRAKAPVGPVAITPHAAADSVAFAPGSDPAVIARIVREGRDASHVDDDLSHLLDVIGPRLAGSEGMRRANTWTRDRFRAYGADSAWLDAWPFGVAWERGASRVTLLAPHRRELIGASWAWSAGTAGPRAGDIVLVDARTDSAFTARFSGRLRGAWVLLGPAIVIPNPDGPPLTHADSVVLDSMRRAAQPATDDERRFFARRLALVMREGIAGIVRDGGKEFNLLSMSGSPAVISPVPQVVIGNNDYAQLERLARRGEHPRLEVTLENHFGRDTLTQSNTIAEIRGTDAPDEVVLLGAHLDSWDLATGATDNGTGAVAVLEAARLLVAAQARPRRTIRFVLFGAEEEGLYGSQAYAAANAAALDRYQAVLVLDNGTGRITGVALQRRDELAPLWRSLFSPLDELGPLAVRSGFKTGTDHLAFLPYGVPSFNFDQLSRGYDHTHHSQVDLLDHAIAADVAQAAAVMAATAYGLANLPQLLVRGPAPR